MGGDAGPVEADQDRLGLHPGHAQAHQMGQPAGRVGVADQGDPRHPAAASTSGPVRRRARASSSAALPPAVVGQGGGHRPEAHDARHVLHAGPPGPLLQPADEQGLDAPAPPDHQGPGARQAAQLVGADRDQVDVELVQAQVELAAGRGGVDVERHAGRPAQLGHPATGWTVPTSWLAHWQWTRAGGPVGVAGQGLGQRLGVDPAHAGRPPGARPGPTGRGVAHGRVLDRGAEHGRAGPGPRGAPKTAALAASVPPEVKTTWRGRTPSSAGDLLPGLLDGVAHRPAFLVDPAGIGEGPFGPGGQGGQGLGPGR